MSQGNQAAKQGEVKSGDVELTEARKGLDSTKELVLQLATIILKSRNAYAKCRNCPRLATRTVSATNKTFDSQDVHLCDGCELTGEWKPTGFTGRIADENLLDTITLANDIINSRGR